MLCEAELEQRYRLEIFRFGRVPQRPIDGRPLATRFAFFPIAISTFSAIGQVDRGLMKAAKDLGASARQIQLKVVIPAALPGILSGLHLGMGVTIILVIAAEMIGGSSESGMGYLLIQAGQIMETEKVFAALIVLAVFGALVTNAQKRLDRLFAPWMNQDR